MDYKRVLTIQDISCVGQCSLTVALPILSACKIETAIMPSAVLSTHTAGFSGYTFRDLTEDMPKIISHWEKENIKFSAIYTGYLGSKEQINICIDAMNKLLLSGGKKIVDPAMADNGKLYYGFDKEFVNSMKKLCATADVVLPNITEACFLTDTEYKEVYDESYIDLLLKKLTEIGVKSVVLTGVGYDRTSTGVIVYEKGVKKYYKHVRYEKGCHGTGDIYASAFTGALVSGRSLYDSAVIAADFTVKCIENTQGDESHWYGAKFEPVLNELIKRI